jgi:sigma-E factor negative regulatory protein RseA
MTEAIREQLSAFVDGELSPVEAELLLKRVDRDPALRATLDSYLLLGAAIRSETTGAPSRDFAARVAKAVDAEQSGTTKVLSWATRLTRRPDGRRKSMWMAVGGSVVAASVVALAILITPHVSQNVPNSPETMAATNSAANSVISNAQTTADEPTVIPADVVRASQLRQQVENEWSSQRDSTRLASYVVAHSQYASPLSRRNALTGLLVEESTGDDSGDKDLRGNQVNGMDGNTGSVSQVTPANSPTR